MSKLRRVYLFLHIANHVYKVGKQKHGIIKFSSLQIFQKITKTCYLKGCLLWLLRVETILSFPSLFFNYLFFFCTDLIILYYSIKFVHLYAYYSLSDSRYIIKPGKTGILSVLFLLHSTCLEHTWYTEEFQYIFVEERQEDGKQGRKEWLPFERTVKGNQ